MAKKPTIEVKRMNLNVPIGLHNAFKAATAAKNKNMTNVLIDFIDQYVRENMTKTLSNKKGVQ